MMTCKTKKESPGNWILLNDDTFICLNEMIIKIEKN